MKTNGYGAEIGAGKWERGRLLAGFLVMMLMVVGATMVLADGSDAEDSPTIASQMPDPDENGKITLTSVVQLTSSYTVPSNVKEIDLGGFKLTATAVVSPAIVIEEGSNVLIHNGTINTIKSGISAKGDVTLGEKLTIQITGANANALTLQGSTATVNGATIDARSFSFGIVLANSDGGNTAESVHSKLVFNSGSVKAGYFTVSMNNLKSAGCEVDINGGTFTSLDSDCPAMYFPAMADINIDNATITGAAGIEIKMGNLSIGPGTTINATGEYKEDYVPPGGEAGSNGSAINIGVHQYGSGADQSLGEVALNVQVSKGAVLNSTNGHSVDVFNMGTNSTDVMKTEIDIEADVKSVRLTNNPSITNIYDIPVKVADADEVIINGSGSMEISGDDVTISGTPGANASVVIKPQANGSKSKVTWSGFNQNDAVIGYEDNSGNTVEPEVVSSQSYVNSTIGGQTYTEAVYSVSVQVSGGNGAVSNVPETTTDGGTISFSFSSASGYEIGDVISNMSSFVVSGTTSGTVTISGVTGPVEVVVTFVESAASNVPVDDDDDLPPFIPTQPQQDDDTTTIVACAAAAVVAALMAVFLIMEYRKR